MSFVAAWLAPRRQRVGGARRRAVVVSSYLNVMQPAGEKTRRSDCTLKNHQCAYVLFAGLLALYTAPESVDCIRWKLTMAEPSLTRSAVVALLLYYHWLGMAMNTRSVPFQKANLDSRNGYAEDWMINSHLHPSQYKLSQKLSWITRSFTINLNSTAPPTIEVILRPY